VKPWAGVSWKSRAILFRGRGAGINQVVSEQMVKNQIGWSPRGAHLVLQLRPRVLNEQREKTFQRWYPAFRPRAASRGDGLTPGISRSLSAITPCLLPFSSSPYKRPGVRPPHFDTRVCRRSTDSAIIFTKLSTVAVDSEVFLLIKNSSYSPFERSKT
jgi:hypothetical protein